MNLQQNCICNEFATSLQVACLMSLFVATCKFTMKRLKSVLRDGITYTVQFQVNLDDSFEISYLGASSPNVGEISLWEADILTPVDFLDYVMYNNAYLNETSTGGPVDIISSNIATLGDMELLNR